jgi:ribonuclease PH
VGLLEGKVWTDLDYVLDSNADVDMNVVMTSNGEFVEVQGTGEESTYSRKQLEELLDSAATGITKLHDIQKEIVSSVN